LDFGYILFHVDSIAINLGFEKHDYNVFRVPSSRTFICF
jgi:hypothetical protein